MLKEYEKQYPIDHHIQSWTADMWAVLWGLWKRGGATKVHKELNFSWATSSVEEYFTNSIFHLAGVTDKTCSDKFYKGKYTNKNIFLEYLKDKTIFDHVSPDNATFEYVKVLKEIAEKKPVPTSTKKYNRFIVKNCTINGLYTEDPTTVHFGKAVWRSSNFILFWNSSCWIATSKQYEKEISESCGGHASNSSEHPYENGWNVTCTISIPDST
jgi:hypothetical protein